MSADTLPEPADPQLYTLLAEATRAALEYIASLDPAKDYSYLGGHEHWRKIEWQENGLPEFSSGSKPKDYYNVLAPFGKDLPDSVAAAFQPLLTYIEGHSRLNTYFGPQVRDGDESDMRWLSIFVLVTYGDVVDRYIHLYKRTEFSEELFKELYLQFERGFLDDHLPIDIVVPVLFTKFDFDLIELAEGIFIERMEDAFQIARVMLAASTYRDAGLSIAPATHALVMRGWQTRSTYHLEISNLAHYPSSYPTDIIDRFFAALRIAADVDTGYSQLLMRPMGWIQHSRAYLPPLEGALTRKYPARLDGRQEEPVPTISADVAAQVGQLFRALDSTDNQKLVLAASRLNMCLLRENEVDAILDATIGMEALLSNDSQEVIHKLSLRMAALAPLSRAVMPAPVQVFRAMKKIYSYRSKVAHGNAPGTKEQSITIEGIGELPTLHAAVMFLRMALSVLLEKQQYLQPEKIDEELLLGKMGPVSG
ncbi:MAG TPA: hypothetical protein VGE04_16695 [Chloroflexia bacterium]